jgi:hypothetical protein
MFYDAVLDGRFQLPIDITTALDEDGSTIYQATYDDIAVTDTNRSEAHRRCTDQILDRIREGRIAPSL